ncbi:MAG TPA: AfsR/SARP family transcriptional regulator [Candidatus Limnocylindrales bacterium]|nr:AfsR/SARP family transcriptional regulator [Candidatus Limnocylindrales bacterium]
MSIIVRLLGTVDIRLGNTVMTIGPQKRRAMLTALALAANQPVSLRTLAEALWGNDSPASATKNLRSYAHALRVLVGRRLVTHFGAYELKLDVDELDVAHFFALADRGAAALATGNLVDAIVAYREALALWRGPALTGVPRTPQLDAVLAGLGERRDAVFEEYCHARLSAGAASELLPSLRRHLAAQPYRERAWGALMLAQYRSGDVYGALGSFGQALSVFREQLGVDPGLELVELHRAILARDPRLDRPATKVLLTQVQSGRGHRAVRYVRG